MVVDDVVLEAYAAQLDKWLPKARLINDPTGPHDAVLHWRAAEGPIKYLIELKPHLEHQDVVAIATQMERYRLDFAPKTSTRLMVLAKYIRRQQGQVLEQRDIDYVDLVGNAHLAIPGRFVHVEGMRPVERKRTRRRVTPGWVKTVMTLLLAPELLNEPYRQIATLADVAPATVMYCLRDLRAEEFLRDVRHTRRIVNLPQLVALWVNAYGEVVRPKLTERKFQMKITDKRERWQRLADVLQQHRIEWALTGADAALLIDPHFHTERTELYAHPHQFDRPDLLRDLQLQPAIEGNVQVIDPPGPIALRRDPNRPQIPTAPALLAYAELRYRNDDQADEAAELLLPRALAHVEA